jgi:transcriptional regulator with XRE-family HTH domain
MVFSGEQIRAARALARIDQIELAGQCGLSVETIKRLERIRGPIDANIRTLRAIDDAFRRIGITFNTGDEGATGVWLTNSTEDVRHTGSSLRYIGERQELPLHRLIYFSTAAAMSEQALELALDDIVRASRPRNRALEVTSVLLAVEGHFLQALEGSKEAVLQIYGSICTDRRHSHLRVAESATVASRHFAGIDMSAKRLRSDDPVFAHQSWATKPFDPGMLSASVAVELLGVVSRIANGRREALRA